MQFAIVFVTFLYFNLDVLYANQCDSNFVNKITISKGYNDTEKCLTNKVACGSLDYVLGMIAGNASYHYLRTSTRITIGDDQILQNDHRLTSLAHFALCGIKFKTGKPVYIRCAKLGNGLTFDSSMNIVFENMTFIQCGSMQSSADHLDLHYYVGVYMTNITDVTVSFCNITNSRGIGMALIDVGGHVTFRNTTFLANTGISSEHGTMLYKDISLNVGGGLAIELTYNCTNDISFCSHGNYSFFGCSFIGNNATCSETEYKLDVRVMTSNHSNIFGSGGGFGMSFKGMASHNHVEFLYCHFINNLANWGGGYLFSFQDKTQNNQVQLTHVHVQNNSALFAGGGGRFGLFPQVEFEKLFATYPNFFHHDACIFQSNKATWGGGLSIFGTTTVKNIKKNNNLVLTKCHWLENQAVVGSAIGLISEWIDPGQDITNHEGHGLAYNIKLVHCTIYNNIILTGATPFSNNVIGTGTVYSDIAPITMLNVSLYSNIGTALVLARSFVEIINKVNFVNNSGSKGGAIALYGPSKIKITPNSELTFNSNRASLQGGAIYVDTQGPNLKAFNAQLLDRSPCFLSYSDPSETDPNSWRTLIVFQNNTAPYRCGGSVYASTLQYCRNYGNFSEILAWRTFLYKNQSEENPEIMTDPVSISSSVYSWSGYPGQNLYPNIQLKDEKNQETNGLIEITIEPHVNSDLSLSNTSSRYIYVSDGKVSSPVTFHSSKMHNVYSIHLSSVYTQVVTSRVENVVSPSFCYGGYKFNEKKQKCVCPERGDLPIGYSHCIGDGQTIYTEAGFWGYIDDGNQLNLIRCPSGYCKCATSDGNDGCIFIKFGMESKQCAQYRKGLLCGTCEKNYSIVVGTEQCELCTSAIGVLWLLLIAAVLTIAVVGILYFEVDFFSGYLNSWLYTYHIILLLPLSSFLNKDPFITLVISLTHGTGDIGTGKCFWNGMDELQKKTLTYFMPFYCLFLLYCKNKLMRRWPSFQFSQNSFHQAFVTILIISYSSLLQNTMAILQPIQINGTYRVYVQADETYFGTYHLYFALPALIVLLFMVIPFPFLIAFNDFFCRKIGLLRRFIPLFHVLQSPYRDKCSWFASYYIFCRGIFIVVKTTSATLQRPYQTVWELISVLILMVFVLLNPYTEENHFFRKVDTCFLTLLCLINSLSIALRENEDPISAKVYRDVIHILVYIPFVYSIGLLIRYTYQEYRRRQLGDAQNLV